MPTPEPRTIRRIDLGDGVPAVEPTADGRAQLLSVWWRDIPLGTFETNDRGLPPRALADLVGHVVAGPVGQRLLGRGFEGWDEHAGLPVPGTVPDLDALLALDRPLERFGVQTADGAQAPDLRVSLVICTRDRPDQLERCLASIARADRRPEELVVVDNAPADATAAVVAAHPEARYVPEPRPGLSRARNTGIEATTGDVVAFVDDDTEVEPRWLERLVAGFGDPEVMAVTGLVLAAELESTAQLGFEKVLGGFSRGFRPLTYGPAFFARTRRFAAPVWKIGAGANMALRRDGLQRVGLYDERLGAGASGCSEDSELWYRLLAQGWTCRYEPASVVLHHHRGTERSYRHQAHEYIRGHVSALFVQYGRFGHTGNLRRALAQMPRHLVRQAIAEGWKRAGGRVRVLPPELGHPALAELTGYARGLRFLPAADRRRHAGGKAPLGRFLANNPYPNAWTEGFYYREKMRAIHRVSPDIAPADVLEVGGGRSGLARLLYPGARVTVLDADASYAESDVNRAEGVTFVAGDATRLPFADASFDVVTFFDVLEHIEDDRAAVAEAWRVVRPGGYVLVSSPNERWRSPYHAVMRPISPSDEEMIARWLHVRRGYSVADYTALFGAPPAVRADFINRITVVQHDVAFSHLPAPVRHALMCLLLPVMWAAYVAQPRGARGTESAVAWRRPAA